MVESVYYADHMSSAMVTLNASFVKPIFDHVSKNRSIPGSGHGKGQIFNATVDTIEQKKTNKECKASQMGCRINV